MKLWKDMNWLYKLNYEKNLNWSAKWLWNDYEMTIKWLWILYEMHYEKTYRIMIWIDYELSEQWFKLRSKYEKVWIDVWKSIFQQASNMKMYEKVFLNKLIIWYFYMKMYESS